MASSEAKSVYYKHFSSYKTIIAQNINLGYNGITGDLYRRKVIDAECRNAINRAQEKEAKGNILVEYLLDKNNADTYEDFLNVWEESNKDDADELRASIHKQLHHRAYDVPNKKHRETHTNAYEPNSGNPTQSRETTPTSTNDVVDELATENFDDWLNIVSDQMDSQLHGIETHLKLRDDHLNKLMSRKVIDRNFNSELQCILPIHKRSSPFLNHLRDKHSSIIRAAIDVLNDDNVGGGRLVKKFYDTCTAKFIALLKEQNKIPSQ